MRISRETFLSTLQSVTPGLDRKGSLEQSSAFVFQKGQVQTFNEEVCCKAPLSLGKGVKGAVPAKKLLDLLSKLTEDEIDVEVSGEELQIKGLSGTTGFRMEAEITLAVDSVEAPGDWTKLPEEFSEAVALVSPSGATGDMRFDLMCVHFAPKFLEATDNTQIMRYRVKTGIKDSSLVRCQFLKALPSLGVLEVSETQSWLHFRNAKGLVISFRRYLDDFPDLSKNLEVNGTPANLPGGMSEAVARASIFSSENEESNKKVLVELRSGKMRICGQGSSGWHKSKAYKTKYDGPAISFLISPEVLAEINKKGTEVEITHNRLKITGEKWVFVSCLSAVKNGEEKDETRNVKKDVEEVTV